MCEIAEKVPVAHCPEFHIFIKKFLFIDDFIFFFKSQISIVDNEKQERCSHLIFYLLLSSFGM